MTLPTPQSGNGNGLSRVVLPHPAPKDPAFITLYGPSGSGKTLEEGRACPNGLFIAAPGALESIRSCLGYDVASTYAPTIEAATQIVKEVTKNRKYDAVIVDDFSFLCEQTFATLEKKLTGYKLWGALRDVVLDFRDAARFAGCHIICSAWEQVPNTKPDGTRVRGGPMLSGKLPEQLPAMCDMVLRCSIDPMRKPWPGVYRCYVDNNYVMKDRLSIVPDPAPMNLGELLRAAGYKLSRHPALPWQEDAVAAIAAQIESGEPADELNLANGAYQTLLTAGIAPPFARFTVSDALDRVVIRRANILRAAVFA